MTILNEIFVSIAETLDLKPGIISTTTILPEITGAFTGAFKSKFSGNLLLRFKKIQSFFFRWDFRKDFI